MFFWKISELSRKAIAYNIQLFIERPFISTVLNYWQNYFFSSVWLISSSNFMYKGNNIHVRKNLWSWKSAAGRKLLAPTTKVLEISFSLAMWVRKCPPPLLTDHIPMKNTPIEAVMSLKILVSILTFSRSLSLCKKTGIIAQSSFVTQALI